MQRLDLKTSHINLKQIKLPKNKNDYNKRIEPKNDNLYLVYWSMARHLMGKIRES